MDNIFELPWPTLHNREVTIKINHSDIIKGILRYVPSMDYIYILTNNGHLDGARHSSEPFNGMMYSWVIQRSQQYFEDIESRAYEWVRLVPIKPLIQ